MQWTHRARHLILWVMVGVAGFAALAPAASKALSRYTGYDWSVVCSAYAPAPTDSSPRPDDGDAQALALEHCPFCVMQAPHLAAAPSARVWLAVIQVSRARPAPVLRAAPGPGFRSAAQPRAPPLQA